MSRLTEKVVLFDCGGESLCGILHLPNSDRLTRAGVVMLVGGPQYRVGSHRQFVLTARALARAGVSVLRFDHRGSGDTGGASRSFEDLGDDLNSAVICMQRECPDVQDVVVWGLCDAASAAALWAPQNSAVTGLVLVNPWVREDSSIARTYLRHYYPRRLISSGFWGKVARGDFDFLDSMKSFGSTLIDAVSRSTSASNPVKSRDGRHLLRDHTHSLQERMSGSLSNFPGRILVLLSGRDLTASEFLAVAESDSAWKKILDDERTVKHVLPDADHTFGSRSDLDRVSQLTSDWVRLL